MVIDIQGFIVYTDLTGSGVNFTSLWSVLNLGFLLPIVVQSESTLSYTNVFVTAF